ncbi:MAG: molybdopterin dehydrogenase FAD-binding protein [Candidatus Eremiobacteraeota bacterium]|nr:molybdopterin dehydrogenase FAD-binding protein [Candidatus Eremiobacteraeota bacterium]
MKPAPFAYHRPSSLSEAIALLLRYDGEAKVLAGGQSLMPVVNMRLARPAALIDLEGVPDLNGIRVDGDRVVFGAMTRHVSVERAPEVRTHLPILARAMSYVGHLAIRSRGTIGGSLAHADPAAELPALAALLDGQFTLSGPNGERALGWSDFFLSYLTTALEPAEILTSISFAIPPPRTRWSFREVARRHGDYALVGIGALTRLAPDDTLEDARIALFGVGPTPVRLHDAERALRGQRPDAAAFAGIAAEAGRSLDPDSDVHASAGYRRDVARTLIARVLAETTEHAA